VRKLEYQQGLLEETPDELDPLSLLGAAATGISRKAGGLLGELLTPSTLEAPTFVRGPEREQNFANWFQQSQAVDEQGNPLKLYHGTKADFDRFDNSYLESATPSVASALGHNFTTEPSVADRFAGASLMQQVMGKTKPGSTIPVNLRLQNPVVFESSFSDPEYTQAHLDKRYKDAYRALHKTLGMDNPGLNQSYEAQVKRAKAWRDSMMEKGHDGIILRNTIRDADSGTSDHYIIFDPNQAKSIYNRGTYSLEDDDLLGMLRRGSNNNV
jgi:hypothetical protein